MADPTEEVVSGCLITRTRAIARVMTGIYDEKLRPFGINSSQFTLLVSISALTSATRSEIGRRNHQDRSTLTRNLRLVISLGWVEEDRGAATGRDKPVRLTATGRKILREVMPAWREAQAEAALILGQSGVNAVVDIAAALP
jgi:DNA-binding MarR family transcriptional regulator